MDERIKFGVWAIASRLTDETVRGWRSCQAAEQPSLATVVQPRPLAG
jgi:hypothetical protein